MAGAEERLACRLNLLGRGAGRRSNHGSLWFQLADVLSGDDFDAGLLHGCDELGSGKYSAIEVAELAADGDGLKLCVFDFAVRHGQRLKRERLATNCAAESFARSEGSPESTAQARVRSVRIKQVLLE